MPSNADTIIEEVFRMGIELKDDGWRLSDALWARMAPLPPPRKPHPFGCHNPRVPDRQAMKAILFVLAGQSGN
jgi:putative transposase